MKLTLTALFICVLAFNMSLAAQTPPDDPQRLNRGKTWRDGCTTEWKRQSDYQIIPTQSRPGYLWCQIELGKTRSITQWPGRKIFRYPVGFKSAIR